MQKNPGVLDVQGLRGSYLLFPLVSQEFHSDIYVVHTLFFVAIFSIFASVILTVMKIVLKMYSLKISL